MSTGYRVGQPLLPSDYRSHLKLMHGVWTTDVKTLKGLAECHDSVHEFPIGYEIPHTHIDEDVEELTTDWVW